MIFLITYCLDLNCIAWQIIDLNDTLIHQNFFLCIWLAECFMLFSNFNWLTFCYLQQFIICTSLYTRFVNIIVIIGTLILSRTLIIAIVWHSEKRIANW